jgi:hypothetical protein
LSQIENELPEFPDEGAPGAEDAQPTDAEATQEAASEEQQNFLLHYRTAEEAERAIREKDSYIGKLQSELNAVKQAVEEIRGLQQYSAYDEDTLEDLIEEDPARAAEEALRRGDPLRLDRALEAWYDVDPRRASQFERRLEMQQLVQQYYAPVQQELGQQQLVAAFQAVRSAHPDFDQLEPLMAKAAEVAPHVLQPLTAGGVEAKKQVIETLYYMARGMREQGAPAQAQAQQPAPTEQQPPQVPYVTQQTNVPPLQTADRHPADLAHDRVLENLARRAQLWENKNK